MRVITGMRVIVIRFALKHLKWLVF